jgi:hypothetical protein
MYNCLISSYYCSMTRTLIYAILGLFIGIIAPFGLFSNVTFLVVVETSAVAVTIAISIAAIMNIVVGRSFFDEDNAEMIIEYSQNRLPFALLPRAIRDQLADWLRSKGRS